MKRNFLLVSMIAAALMTASCSKDDEKNPVEEQQIEQQTQVKQTRPIVIKAGKKSSVSKVATEDGYTLKFSQTDKLVLTDGTNTYAELNVDRIADDGTSATFKGEISTNADGQTIYAKIGTALTGVKTSTESLAAVVASNCYLKSAEFTYNANSEQFSVDLYDQNAYLVFNVAEGQKKVEITLGGVSGWYPTDGNIANQYLYVALPSGQAISGRFFGSKSANDVSAGKIYTITRTDLIDLGPAFDVIWKTCNEGASSPTENGTFHQWANACSSFGTKDAPKAGSSYRLPTLAEFVALVAIDPDNGWTEGITGWTFANEYGSLYFRATGTGASGDFLPNLLGRYWAGELYPNSNNGSRMGFELKNGVTWADTGENGNHNYFPVRLVLPLE